MSNFENEYRKHSAETTPDLWARIEAGIDEYEASNAKTESESITKDNPEQTIKNNVISINDKKKINITKYIGIIAAAACLLIAIPAIVLMKDNSSHSETTASEAVSAAEEAAAPMEAPAAAEYEEVAEVTDEAPSATFNEEAMSDSTLDEPATVYEADIEEAATEDIMEETDNSYDFATKESAKKFEKSLPFRAIWDADAKSPSDEVIIIDNSIPDSKIRFSFNEEVRGFRILNLNITDVTEDGELVYTYSEATDGRIFKKGDEITYEMSFLGDIPNYGVAYLDEKGEEHLLSIYESGFDGSICLDEL